jgi:hypothetical protein
MDGTKLIRENGGEIGESAAVVMGLLIFGISIYAFSLAIKVNRLSLRKLKDEGYE